MRKLAWAALTVAAIVGLAAYESHHGPNAATASTNAGAGSASLTTLRIAPAGPMTGYTRLKFGDGWETKGNGCSTRVDVLISQGRAVVHHGCTVISGHWLSLYDGVAVTSPHALDIDHIVPEAEAWRTGAASWTTARRETFANDPAELVAVTAHSNRSKGDDPPPAYEPVAVEKCAYATQWIAVKVKYGLAISSGELHALTAMVNTCPKGK